MAGRELEELVFKHLPEAFLRQTLRAVFAAHAVSWEDAKAGYARAEALNLQPYMKRAKLEGYLRDVADQFPGVDSIVCKSSDTGWWFHTEIRSGPVILTESAVPSPCALVDKADFRVSLAKSNWLTLFPDERVAEDAPLYAVLLHSKSRWLTEDDRKKYEHLPGSAYLAFPAAGLNEYVHEINLFERFPDVVTQHLPKEWTADARIRYQRNARRPAA